MALPRTLPRWLVLAGLLLTACTSGDSQPASNAIQRVVVVHLDTTRVDALGSYGGVDATPNIDALAAEGLRFTNAIAPTPRTSPSIAAFMTGRLSHRSGVYTVGDTLPQGFTTLAEILKENGFATGGFTGNFVVANHSDGESVGYDQGFDVYEAVLDDVEVPTDVDPRRFARDNAAALTKEALSFVREHADERFFLWLLFLDPHAPYVPPAPYDTMFARDPSVLSRQQRLDPDDIDKQALVGGELDAAYYISRYYGEVRLVDESIGALRRVVDALPGKTLWIVTADHGESLGERNIWFNHGYSLSHTCVDVPLILSCDGVVPVGTSDALAANVDIAPTILDLLGLSSAPLGSDGRSLRAAFSDPDPWPKRMVPINVAQGARWRGVRTANWSLQTKLHPRSGMDLQTLLFHVKKDPTEDRNVAAKQPHQLRRLKRFERKWFLKMGGHAPQKSIRSDPEMAARLRALGYVD